MARLFRRKRQDPEPQLTETSADDVVAGMVPFITTPERLPPGAFPVVEPFPGLVAAVAVQQDSMVNFLPQETIAQLGGNRAVLEAAITNLRALPAPSVETVPMIDGRTDTDVWVFGTSDMFGASRICALDQLLTVLGPAGAAPHGVFVAMPTWRLLMLHPLGGESAPAVVGRMATFALACHTDEPEQSRVSRDVYYVAPDGRPQIVAYDDGTGGIAVDTRGLLGETLFGRDGLLERFKDEH